MSAKTFFDRYGPVLRQFIKFGLVGGAGVLVNLGTVALCNFIGYRGFGIDDRQALFMLPGSNRGLRYYVLYAGIAFVVAVTFNFIINRHWTFKGHGEPAPFFKEFWPFFLVGAIAQIAGFFILILLRNENSPLYLRAAFFTYDGPWYTRRQLWAQFIQIICVMPINFVVNKLWTFRHVRNKHAATQAAADEASTPSVS